MIKNLKINDGKATALISLSPSGMQPYDIPIFIDDESGDIQRESQIYSILDRVENFSKRINIDDLIRDISIEINQACYEQSDYEPTEFDNKELANDLKIVNITAYFDELVFIYYSGSFLPDMEISAQITYEGELENLEIYDKQQAVACMKPPVLTQGMCSTHAHGFCFLDDFYPIASSDGGARLLFAEVDSGQGNLTAIYGRDGKNCAVSPTAQHNLLRYYDSDAGWFVNQDPIGLLGGENHSCQRT